MSAAELYGWLRADPIGWVMVALVGAAFGSFINVVIYRLPRGLSLVSPPSRCVSCERRIRPHENIPILSYVLLRGRCRGCGSRIPLRYPAVELAAAALTCGAVALTGYWLEAVVWILFTLSLLAVIFIDLDFQIIPDRISLPGAALGVLWALLGPPPVRDALLGVLAGGGGLFLIAVAYQRIAGREGMGMGDVKLMAMVGAFLGWQGALGTLLVGSLTGSLVGGLLIARGKGSRQTALPFGTFLAPAAYLVLFAGEALWRAYLSLLFSS